LTRRIIPTQEDVDSVLALMAQDERLQGKDPDD
jgi:hypothetical protein